MGPPLSVSSVVNLMKPQPCWFVSPGRTAFRSALSSSRKTPTAATTRIMSEINQGSVFLSFDSLVHALDQYAIRHKTSYKVLRRDQYRFVAVCVNHKTHGCEWRLRATCPSRNRDVVVTRFNASHNCPEHLRAQSNVATSVRYLLPHIQHEIHANPQCSAAELMRILQERDGIKVSYMSAYRSRELSRKALYGSEADAFRMFPKLCNYLRSIDPNATVDRSVDSESRFYAGFFCPGACKAAFLCSRPVVSLSALTLKGKPNITVLMALGLDANDSTLMLAFSLVPIEDHNSWSYFLANLVGAIPSLTTLETVLVSKHANGSASAASLLLPDVPHSQCTWSMAEEVGKQYGRGPQELFTRAARTTKKDKYMRLMREMSARHEAAATLVTNAEPITWAATLFPRRR